MARCQQTFQSTLKELYEARRELKELISVSRSLREDIEWSVNSASSHSSCRPVGASAAAQPNPLSPHPEEEDEEDWPAPPPWPGTEDDLPIGMSDLNQGQLDKQQSHLPHSFPNPAKSSSMFASQPHQFVPPAPYNGTMPYPPSQPPQPLSYLAPVYTDSRPPVLPRAAPPPMVTRASPSSLPTTLYRLPCQSYCIEAADLQSPSLSSHTPVSSLDFALPLRIYSHQILQNSSGTRSSWII